VDRSGLQDVAVLAVVDLCVKGAAADDSGAMWTKSALMCRVRKRVRHDMFAWLYLMLDVVMTVAW
jgi:hypothetical protein